jgi:hypothetical protein
LPGQNSPVSIISCFISLVSIIPGGRILLGKIFPLSYV